VSGSGTLDPDASIRTGTEDPGRARRPDPGRARVGGHGADTEEVD